MIRTLDPEWIRIGIQHKMLDTDPDAESGTGSVSNEYGSETLFITRYFTQMYEMSEIDPSTTERLLATRTYPIYSGLFYHVYSQKEAAYLQESFP
jgi:hypothetical protein